MLLRSSSTPILGSLLSSYSDSPHGHHHNHHSNHHHNHHNNQHSNHHHNHHNNPPKHQQPIKLSLHQTTPPNNLFTPSPPAHNPNNSSHGCFRRIQSEGNLNELLSDSFSTFEVLNPHHLITNKFSSNPHCSVSEHGTPSSDDDEEELGEVMSTGGFGGGGGWRGAATGGGAGDGRADVEEYYQRMMQEYPWNPLFVSNYAQFLHQSNDLAKAEEYYSRATLIDPGDAEILWKYAQLTWELHRDQERTSIHFQRAIQAAPQDSHVLAAYAGFLWETDEEEEEDNDMVCAVAPSYRCRGEFRTDKYDADSVF